MFQQLWQSFLQGTKPKPRVILERSPFASATPQVLNSAQQNQIKGVIYGNALGDAMGLATEFLTPQTIAKHYGADTETKLLPFPNYVYISMNNSNFVPGDWTDDTDHLILILQTLIHNKLQVNEREFAVRLKHWMQYGFSELGDDGGYGIGMTTRDILSRRGYTKDPMAVATQVWKESGENLAPNGALMRTSILGTLNFLDLNQVAQNTEAFCTVTHADSRCVASCIAITVIIAQLLQNKQQPLETVLQAAYQHAKRYLHPKHEQEFEYYYKETDLDRLQLHDESMGYTLKCMAAAMYALRSSHDFTWTMHHILRRGGDADTNCAVAGALYGVRHGYEALPSLSIHAMPNKGWLDDQVEHYLQLLGVKQ